MSHFEEPPGDILKMITLPEKKPARPRSAKKPESRKPSAEKKPAREKALPLPQISQWREDQKEALSVYLDALDRVDQLFDLVAEAERRRKKEGSHDSDERSRAAQEIYVQARQELSTLATAVGVPKQDFLDLDVGRKGSRERVREFLKMLPTTRSRAGRRALSAKIPPESIPADPSGRSIAVGSLTRLERLRQRRDRAAEGLADVTGAGSASRRALFEAQVRELDATIADELRKLGPEPNGSRPNERSFGDDGGSADPSRADTPSEPVPAWVATEPPPRFISRLGDRFGAMQTLGSDRSEENQATASAENAEIGSLIRRIDALQDRRDAVRLRRDEAIDGDDPDEKKGIPLFEIQMEDLEATIRSERERLNQADPRAAALYAADRDARTARAREPEPPSALDRIEEAAVRAVSWLSRANPFARRGKNDPENPFET